MLDVAWCWWDGMEIWFTNKTNLRPSCWPNQSDSRVSHLHVMVFLNGIRCIQLFFTLCSDETQTKGWKGWQIFFSDFWYFFLYLCSFQMTKVTKEHCLEIVTKFEPCPENQKQGVLGIDGKMRWSVSSSEKILITWMITKLLNKENELLKMYKYNLGL